MSSKARHRKPYHLLDYPLPWYVRQAQNRKALRNADKRIRARRRQEKRASFWFDLREWFTQGE